MLELNELSKIGFGGYRVSLNSSEHFKALNHALDSGCNLIDTSTNYTDGGSERLIGEVLASRPGEQPFIVTKAGYVEGESLELLEELNRAGKAKNDIIRTAAGSLHSFAPDFLDKQIDLSCHRLKRSQLDGFLLHNPEYYFDQNTSVTSQDGYYHRIKTAFEFLEEQAGLGRIRYYGVSSNTFPHSIVRENSTSLSRILALAEEVSVSHHFKLIEFPFNLIENDAQKPQAKGLSLIEVAHANGIVTLANRPLNANSSNGSIRLATYEDEISPLDEERDQLVLHECLGWIQQRLDEVGIDDNIMQFMPIQIVSHGWMSFSSPDIVAQVFDQHFLPFLERLYEGKIADETLDAVDRLRRIAVLYAKKYMTDSSLAFRRQMMEQGTLARDDDRPLPVIACQSYLDAGIDHVLVGMTKPKYVDSLRNLF